MRLRWGWGLLFVYWLVWAAVAWAAPVATTIRTALVAELPTATVSNRGKIYLVRDASTDSTCMVGGGAYENFCQSTGSAWVVIPVSGATAGGQTTPEADKVPRALGTGQLDAGWVLFDGTGTGFVTKDTAGGPLTASATSTGYSNEWRGSGHASLNALVTAAGSTTGEAVLDSTLTVTAVTPVTIPTTLAVTTRGNGHIDCQVPQGAITSIARGVDGQTVTVTFSEATGWSATGTVTVTGVADQANFPNGTFSYTGGGGTTLTYTQAGANVSSVGGVGTQLLVPGNTQSFLPISSITRSTNIVTVNFAAASGWPTTGTVTISGVADQINFPSGTYAYTKVGEALTYTQTGTGTPSSSGGTAQLQLVEIDGPFEVGEEPIFSNCPPGAVVFGGRGIAAWINARWWGAFGNGAAASDALALQASLYACGLSFGCDVYWAPGIYRTSNFTLRPPSPTVAAQHPFTLWAYGAELIHTVGAGAAFEVVSVAGVNIHKLPTTIFGLEIYQPTNGATTMGVRVAKASNVVFEGTHVVAGGNAVGYSCFRVQELDPANGANTGAYQVYFMHTACKNGTGTVNAGWIFEGQSNAITVRDSWMYGPATSGVIIRDQSGSDGSIPNDILVDHNDFETITTDFAISSTLATAGVLGLRFTNNRIESLNAATVLSVTGITSQTANPHSPPLLMGNHLELFSTKTYLNNPNNLLVNAWDVQEDLASPLAVVPPLATIPGTGAALTATAPRAAASTTAGVNATLTASNATAGTTNAGAQAGGAVTITGGNAAQKTSGDAVGGDVTLAGGAGVGTGRHGQVLVGDGGLRIVPAATTSVACAAGTNGALFFDSDLNELCFCNGGTAKYRKVSAPAVDGTSATDCG